MKFLKQVAIAFAGLSVAMVSAVITTGIATPVIQQDQATVLHKAENLDGSCALTFDLEGSEFVIEEAPLVCQTIDTGDIISY